MDNSHPGTLPTHGHYPPGDITHPGTLPTRGHYPPGTLPTGDITHRGHYPPGTLPTRDITHPWTLPTRDITHPIFFQIFFWKFQSLKLNFESKKRKKNFSKIFFWKFKNSILLTSLGFIRVTKSFPAFTRPFFAALSTWKGQQKGRGEAETFEWPFHVRKAAKRPRKCWETLSHEKKLSEVSTIFYIIFINLSNEWVK